MADTNAGALCEAGRRDAQALTVTGRRRAHTGSIRRAVKALTRTAKAVTPETPDGAWLRDNQTLARTAASDAAAALRHAHTLRASGAQTVLHVCCAGLLRACGNALTPKAAQAYLAGFQDVLPLETAELALLVPGLQAVTVCALADTYAHDGAAAPALFTSLRALGTAAWAALTERCDRVGRILARDPAGVYPAMDAATRTRYRQTVAQLARRTGRTEIDIAEDVLTRAQSGEGARRHVGWFLLREVLGAPEKRRDGAWYIAAVIVGTLALSLLLGFATGSVSGAVLLLIPVSEAVKGLLDAVLLRVTKPRFVPRLALRRGIPPEGKTLCVIAALLTCPGDAHTLAARLEEYALCNRDAGEQLLFGLLADLPEADMEHAPIDPAILHAAREEIEALNARYGGRFYLFTRERVQTPDGKWSAWERKRGALLRLAQLLCGEADAMHCAAGDAAALRGTAYLLTLDADTRLTPGAARALAGAMLHPLNRPVVDAQRGVVTHGYGLLHPRMATELESANATDWARVFAGPGGSDPYGGVCGELYMDCFDRGGFSGKGILDVRALLACCGGAGAHLCARSSDRAPGGRARALSQQRSAGARRRRGADGAAADPAAVGGGPERLRHRDGALAHDGLAPGSPAMADGGAAGGKARRAGRVSARALAGKCARAAHGRAHAEPNGAGSRHRVDALPVRARGARRAERTRCSAAAARGAAGAAGLGKGDVAVF